MRIITSLLTSLVIIVVAGGILGLVGREVWLIWGTYQVRFALQEIRTLATHPEEYVQACQKKGALSLSQASNNTFQVRFTSSTEWNVEVVCANFTLDPVVISSGSLPKGVTKVPGTTGIIWGTTPSVITLEFLGRQRTIGVDNEDIGTFDQASSQAGPATSCEGYGYTCCIEANSTGVGESFSGAINCPTTCFATCQSRPVILSIATQPFADQATRQVTIARGETFELNYVVDFGSPGTGTVQVDFGDGSSEESAKANGSHTHTYACTSAQCRYSVTVTATDSLGTVSATTTITRFDVVVN